MHELFELITQTVSGLHQFLEVSLSQRYALEWQRMLLSDQLSQLNYLRVGSVSLLFCLFFLSFLPSFELQQVLTLPGRYLLWDHPSEHEMEVPE